MVKPRFHKQNTLVHETPQSSEPKMNKSLLIEELHKKRKKVSHIHITDKKLYYARGSKLYSDDNPMLRSEGRRTNMLKPIVTNKHGSKSSYSKDTSAGIVFYMLSFY